MLCCYGWVGLLQMVSQEETQSHSSPCLPACLPCPALSAQVRLSKQLTELEKQFYGSSMAYDRALQEGKEPLDQVG